MSNQPVVIRRPRNWLSLRNHRFVGCRIGQIVWYNSRNGPRQYVVVDIEDCYDWAKPKYANVLGGSNLRKFFSRYIWIEPLNKKRKPPIRQTEKFVMPYNKQLWDIDNVGHGVEYDKIFFSEGECAYSYME